MINIGAILLQSMTREPSSTMQKSATKLYTVVLREVLNISVPTFPGSSYMWAGYRPARGRDLEGTLSGHCSGGRPMEESEEIPPASDSSEWKTEGIPRYIRA